MRVFIGIPIPDKMKDKISELQKKFDIKGIKLVEPKNLHWTVKFFGYLKEEVKEVKKIMDKIHFEPFKIGIGGVGVFPSLSYIRTIWIGVDNGKKEFLNFLEDTKNKFTDIGKSDNKGIKPHLTIGRVKRIYDKEKLIDLIEKNRKVKIGETKIDRLVLYKSTLTPKGPIYEALKEIIYG